MKMSHRIALSCAAIATLAGMAVAAPALATDTIVWWDYMGGGDGVRLKALIDAFNKEHVGKVQIQATTLDWGEPYYTKIQTSAAVGQGPDVMAYHESRLPLGVSTGSLSEITPDELKAAGISSDQFEASNWKALQGGGKQYAIPLDVTSIALYYNKDMLKKAGLLGDDGKPLPSMLDSAEHFDAALKKLTANGVQGLSLPTADGATMWRVFYSLFNQEDGVFLTPDNKFLDGDNVDKAAKAIAEMASWVKNGYLAPQTEYPASIALFTSGKAALHINGVWELPTMTDLSKQGKLFDWGAVQVPTFFAHPASWTDSDAFAIPNRVGNPVSPAKRAMVLDTIHWLNEHSISWATAGHIPAYLPVQNTDAFKSMKPNADYASLAKTAAFDPVSTLAGVASPVYDAAGNYIMPAVNGELDPADAASQMRDDLQGQVK